MLTIAIDLATKILAGSVTADQELASNGIVPEPAQRLCRATREAQLAFRFRRCHRSSPFDKLGDRESVRKPE
ncbi:hypothetical protein [Salinarimonas ramus]|uniref:hypothetical protein n=1 Tax=Salinarimonas ramus TaxID=690164 RepID=UPI00166F1672|nr:hypothetical protein [Salinarimonas ramus]